MDYRKWTDCEWSDEVSEAFRAEMRADLEAKLAGRGISVLKSVPRDGGLSIVVGTDDKLRWLHVVLDDAHDAASFGKVSLRRMSSERDWKGEVFHHCDWNAIGEHIAELMKPEYDGEI